MKIKNINTGKSYCGGILQLLCHNSVPLLTLKSFTCEFEIFRIFVSQIKKEQTEFSENFDLEIFAECCNEQEQFEGVHRNTTAFKA